MILFQEGTTGCPMEISLDAWDMILLWWACNEDSKMIAESGVQHSQLLETSYKLSECKISLYVFFRPPLTEGKKFPSRAFAIARK